MTVLLLIAGILVVMSALGMTKGVNAVIAAIVAYVCAAAAFMFGITISFLFMSESYWKSYRLPELFIEKYPFDHNGTFGYEAGKMLVTGFLDTLLIMVHFTFTNGNVILWASQAIVAWFFVVHFLAMKRF